MFVAMTKDPSWSSFPITMRYHGIRNPSPSSRAAGGKKEANIGEALQLLVALREAICRRRVNKQPPRSRDGL